MNSANRKLLLEIYGLSRLVLGAGQLVGLSAGYFFLEFFLKYPSHQQFLVFDEDILVLTYLAVFLRAVFHVVAGIGIARQRLWVKGWLSYGWLIIAIVIVGVLHSTYQLWIEEGAIRGFSQIVSWPKLIIYLAVIVFDLIFIRQSVQLLNDNPSSEQGIEAKKIALVFFISVLVFSIILFVGKPIKQGFHQGFYKSRGKKSSQTLLLESKRAQKRERSGQLISSTKLIEDQPILSDTSSETETVLSNVPFQELQTEQSPLNQDDATIKQQEMSKDLPYRKIIGWLAGLFLIIGFILQIFEMMQTQKTQSVSALSYVLFSFGFFLWIVYGLSFHLTPIVLTGFVCLGSCLAIILMKFKYNS